LRKQEEEAMGEQYAPSDERNPWKLDTFMTAEEWKEVSRWYAYSLRSLMFDGRWYEHARCRSRDDASQLLRALASHHPQDVFIIVHCTLVGKDGREKMVYGYPGSEQSILRERQARREQRR
jgi:hypothetical protein